MSTKITRLSKPDTTINSLVCGDKFSVKGLVYMKVPRFTRPGGVEANAVDLVNGVFIFIHMSETITPHGHVEIVLS